MAAMNSPSATPNHTHSPFESFDSFSFLQNFSLSSTWLYTSLVLVAGLLVLEQAIYRSKKADLPGAKWTIPIIGKFADSMNPSIEGYQKQWDSGALSAISVFNMFVSPMIFFAFPWHGLSSVRFIVLASSNEYTRKILNSPTYAEPCLVASAKQVLCPDNWHVWRLCGSHYVSLFIWPGYSSRGRSMSTIAEFSTPFSLAKLSGKPISLGEQLTHCYRSLYLSAQDSLARKQFAKWIAASAASDEPLSFMMPARYLNMRTSLKVFCGPHIPEEAIQEITEKYWLLTRALELVNFPLALPGTKVYGAVQARKVVMKWLENAARLSKIAIRDGQEASCLIDRWVQEFQNPDTKGRKDFSDREVALVVLSFLLASQDAMSSGIIYAFQHFADHPEVLAKVREEQRQVRGGDYSKPMTLEMLDDMPYLKAAIRESLRLKPPVCMVRAHRDYTSSPHPNPSN